MKALRSRPKMWVVYVLQSASDGTLYTGISTNLEKRLKAHNAGKGAKRTRGRGPWTVVGVQECPNRVRAMEREYQLKHADRAMKFAWCGNHPPEALQT